MNKNNTHYQLYCIILYLHLCLLLPFKSQILIETNRDREPCNSDPTDADQSRRSRALQDPIHRPRMNRSVTVPRDKPQQDPDAEADPKTTPREARSCDPCNARFMLGLVVCPIYVAISRSNSSSIRI